MQIDFALFAMVGGFWHRAFQAFSPMVQDRMAVVLIEGKNALHLVRTAQIEAAVQALRSTWTSLPGANQNAAGRTMEVFKSNFALFLAEEKRKVGLA